MRGTDSERSNVVSNTALSPHPLTRTALILAPRSAYLVTGALVFAALAWFLSEGLVGMAALAVAGTLAALATVISWLSLSHARSHGVLQDQIAAFIDNDASPSFTTDADGEIGTQNRAALQRFGSRGGQTLTRALAEVFANPAAVLHRLQNRADALGAAREDLVTRRGHVRLSVHRIGDAGFLWRLEDMAERAVGGRGAEFYGEVGKLAPGVVEGLAERGIVVKGGRGEESGLHGVIVRGDGALEGGADPRREGQWVELPR